MTFIVTVIVVVVYSALNIIIITFYLYIQGVTVITFNILLEQLF